MPRHINIASEHFLYWINDSLLKDDSTSEKKSKRHWFSGRGPLTSVAFLKESEWSGGAYIGWLAECEYLMQLLGVGRSAPPDAAAQGRPVLKNGWYDQECVSSRLLWPGLERTSVELGYRLFALLFHHPDLVANAC